MNIQIITEEIKRLTTQAKQNFVWNKELKKLDRTVITSETRHAEEKIYLENKEQLEKAIQEARRTYAKYLDNNKFSTFDEEKAKALRREYESLENLLNEYQQARVKYLASVYMKKYGSIGMNDPI
jgi:Spy/CpxP family protein refolding chaperone